ncbi:MAG TPA: class IV adenylate cyclase [Thermoanaerobaculia bacterium]|jgi:adenylate cyclase class 2
MDNQQSAVERELKYSAVDLDELRVRLERLEAEKQGTSALEDNWIFDRDGELAATGSILRLRIDRRGSRLTFKGPAAFEGSVKVRLEHEAAVGDSNTMRRILEALGYEPVHRYQKYREEWRLGSLTIALDHTPIGDFAEIEGEGCETVARRLNLDSARLERRNYLRLYADHQKEHPDAPPDMVFREEKKD